ncbi:BTB/POZ domain-containing protein kctd14, variant 2 [Trebouxia sp. C0009 RCD-2024]
MLEAPISLQPGAHCARSPLVCWSGQHFGTVLAYLHGEQVDMVCSRSLVDEANYYQLDGLLKELTSPQGSSVVERGTARSLEHYCEVLRHSIGCDVIDAVEDALIDMCMRAPANHMHDQDISSAQCSNALDLNSYKSQRHVELRMMKSEFESPICTSHWGEQIRLFGVHHPAHQLTGADAANFTKILYKCYGVIVKDLEKKGFTVSVLAPQIYHRSTHQRNYNFNDMSTTISICPIWSA